MVILFLPPQLPGLCLHPLDVMTLLLQNRLVSSEDLFFACSLCWKFQLSIKFREQRISANRSLRQPFHLFSSPLFVFKVSK